MGAIPNKLPGFQDIEHDAEARAQFERAWGVDDPAEVRLAPDRRCSRRWSTASCTALYVIGENPAQSEADQHAREQLLEGLDHLVVQDIFLTKTAELADVVLPASATLVRGRGHGHQQRAPRAARAQGARAARRGARRHRDHLRARRSGSATTGARPTRRGRSGTSCARSSPMHARHELRAARGARRHPVAVPRRGRTRARCSCTAGCGQRPGRRARPRRSASSSTSRRSTSSTTSIPLRLTTGRRLDSYNTGVQTRRLHVAAAARRVARPLARGLRAARRRRRRARCGSPRAAARSRRRCASTARCGRASCS